MFAEVPEKFRSRLGRLRTATADQASALPERVKTVIAAEDRRAERLIGFVQLSIGTFIWMLYLIAPRPADAAATMFMPVPLALTAFTLFSLFRLWLIFGRKTPDWFVAISILADIGLVLGLVWSFHIQYAEPAGLMLKAPAFAYLFVLVVLRALRFNPRYVIAAGAAAAMGWLALTAIAIVASGGHSITHSFTEYLKTDRILIGAEVEKVVILIVVTALLAISATRAQRTLTVSLREQAALLEVRRFLPKGVADQIASAGELIEAGHAVERDAAILMLDIRGFTALSMRMPPAEVVRILTSLHARIIPIVRANGGVIDKFLGDGVMATFGAANVSVTAAVDALRALEDILQTARDWRLGLPAQGVPVDLVVNAATAAGQVVFATLGHGDRLEYTVIGDAVNLAAKLEKHNKAENSVAVIPRHTFERALAQGFNPTRSYEHRPLARVAGVTGAIDLCVTLPDAAGTVIAAGY